MSQILVTCEHGGKKIPPEYRNLFRGRERILQGPQGHDLGALEMAKAISTALKVPLLAASAPKLLVDPDRSPESRGFFNEFTHALSPAEKRRLVRDYHTPHRREVEQQVARAVRHGQRVVHISVHSFPPNGELKDVDVAIVYDSRRGVERYFAQRWRADLRVRAPKLTLRLNRPLKSRTEGVTRWLRKHFEELSYFAIELEFNQRLVGSAGWEALKSTLGTSLATIINSSYS